MVRAVDAHAMNSHPDSDNSNWFSSDVDSLGYFNLHLSASDYELVMYALETASDSELLYNSLMDWNHCDRSLKN